MTDIALPGNFAAVRGISLGEARVYALLAAILVYAVAGVPTPDGIGAPEILVGVLLLTAAGGARVLHALVRETMPGGAMWQAGARLLLIYGLTVPVLTGLANGHGPGLIIRDIVPFLFLLLPLFFMPLLMERQERAGLLALAVAMAGFVFAIRVFLPVWQAGSDWSILSDPNRFANSPAVLFAALLFLGTAGQGLYRSAGIVSFGRSLICVLVALPPLLAMAYITQRASMGLVSFSLILLAVCGLIRRPGRAILPALLLAVGIVLGWETIAGVGQALMHKTMLVGGNMRWEEAEAVLDRLGGGPYSALFGRGWGSTFADPAVGGKVVNYTHNLLTTYLLKTGLCGLALVLIYLAGLAILILRLVLANPVMGLALAGPFLIDVTLYATFKSLDFGLVLMLIPLGNAAARQLHKNPSYSIQEAFPEPEPEKTGLA